MRKILKSLSIPILLIGILMCGLVACNDDEHQAEPIAPILKGVKIPGINSVMPGNIVTIEGVGFDKSDKLILSQNAEILDVEVTEVTDSYIKFLLPLTAGGDYTVTVQRAGKETQLKGVLKAPFIVPVTDVVLPEDNVLQQSEIIILGQGFEKDDNVKFTASFYPVEAEFTAPITIVENGIKVVLPKGVYGVNNVLIERKDEGRQSNLGTITIETSVGDVLGGGVVYWVNSSKSHGLIASFENVGSALEQFGPEVGPTEAVGTKKEIGSGAQNTASIVKMMDTYRSKWAEWKSVVVASELCANYEVKIDGLTYNDWYLPSQDELIELFYKKVLLAEKGASVPPNNYWTSTEGLDDGTKGWAAFYVNFYEETNLVTGLASKSGWKIGVRPIRSY